MTTLTTLPLICNQCEQTAHGQGCQINSTTGVCGKNQDIESLQQVLQTANVAALIGSRRLRVGAGRKYDDVEILGQIRTSGADVGGNRTERLLDVVRDNAGRSAREIQAAILDAIANHTNNSPQFDDITLVVIKRNT